mmetsp:Transcript_1249/g.3382  ORF Transcript_1249/g.3382 Transcript_1249/m.3382 type:complete len:469 (-) Transcript_1249:2294-3700(-)
MIVGVVTRDSLGCLWIAQTQYGSDVPCPMKDQSAQRRPLAPTIVSLSVCGPGVAWRVRGVPSEPPVRSNSVKGGGAFLAGGSPFIGVPGTSGVSGASGTGGSDFPSACSRSCSSFILSSASLGSAGEASSTPPPRSGSAASAFGMAAFRVSGPAASSRSNERLLSMPTGCSGTCFCSSAAARNCSCSWPLGIASLRVSASRASSCSRASIFRALVGSWPLGVAALRLSASRADSCSCARAFKAAAADSCSRARSWLLGLMASRVCSSSASSCSRARIFKAAAASSWSRARFAKAAERALGLGIAAWRVCSSRASRSSRARLRRASPESSSSSSAGGNTGSSPGRPPGVGGGGSEGSGAAAVVAREIDGASMRSGSWSSVARSGRGGGPGAAMGEPGGATQGPKVPGAPGAAIGVGGTAIATDGGASSACCLAAWPPAAAPAGLPLPMWPNFSRTPPRPAVVPGIMYLL